MTKTKNVLLASVIILSMAGCSKNGTTEIPVTENAVELQGRNAGPSANGHGSLNTTTGMRQFSFHANTKPNGSVEGSGIITNTGPDNPHIKFDINCLTVTGNVASMSGVITQSNAANAPVGGTCRFRVVDNGEGTNAVTDLITLVQVSPGVLPDCNSAFAFGLLQPIVGGNIQVKQ